MTSVAANMRDEVNESPAVVRRQEALLAEPITFLVKRIATSRPRLVMTCARGSSTHAAKFAKHMFERYLGIPVAAAAPNIATQYHRSLDLDGQLFLSISQSGRSDDLVETTLMARRAGALTVSLVNDPASPLACASELVLPLCAGPELSVAATKSFVASLAALMQIVAAWTGDPPLRGACVHLPDRLAAASLLDWSAALAPLAEADSVATIGRGPTFAIAYEAALKLKETCELHAEAFSAAEFRHGPIALVSAAYPVLLFHPNDEAGNGFSDLAGDLRRIGGCVLVAGGVNVGAAKGSNQLPTLTPQQPEADAICLIQSFYGLLATLAACRGKDADRPRHLQKVTRTR
jgi:glutamine---fructose-6-phosphate transaminase (isomerizing)